MIYKNIVSLCFFITFFMIHSVYGADAFLPYFSLAASSFQNKTTGYPGGSTWIMYSNGLIKNTVNFPTSGNYKFQIEAYGDLCDNIGPLMEVKINGQLIKSISVPTHTSQVYTFIAHVNSSNSEVSISFTNDFSRNGQDRNLYLKKLSISNETLNQLTGDMTLPHESTIHGINPSWDWGSKPRVGAGVKLPAGFNDPHFTAWGIIGSATSGSPARNTRVQMRHLVVDIKRNGTWERLIFNAGIVGSIYTNFQTNTAVAANLRDHGADGISVKLPDAGGTFHFFSSNRYALPAGVEEIVTKVESRLIVDSSSLADDRASAKLLAVSAGDFWRARTNPWSLSPVSNVDYAIGRFRYVTNDWAEFTSHTFTTSAEYMDYLAHEPGLLPAN